MNEESSAGEEVQRVSILVSERRRRVRRMPENYGSKSALAGGEYCLMIPRDSACRLGHPPHRGEMGSLFPADRAAPALLHQTRKAPDLVVKKNRQGGDAD